MLAKTPIVALTALMALAIQGEAHVAAAEFCVTCAGPDAHYACSLEGAADISNDAGLKLYCITELAKSGQHDSCSVDRTEAKPCAGTVKVLAIPDGMATAPQPSASVTDVPKTTPPTAASVSPSNSVSPAAGKIGDASATTGPEAQPKTVQELVEKSTGDAGKTLQKGGDAVVDTAKATGGVLDKAGKAVGDSAKKTWTCITSFFGNC